MGIFPNYFAISLCYLEDVKYYYRNEDSLDGTANKKSEIYSDFPPFPSTNTNKCIRKIILNS